MDGFILETFSDLEELHAAYLAARSVADLPVIAQMTVREDGNTSYGTSVETIATRLEEWGVDVAGLNCSVGPAPMLEAIERMAEVTTRPLSAQPNAGLPRAVGDRRIYLASPGLHGAVRSRLIQSGVRFIGGCCGTTPEHIRRIREYVAGTRPRQVAVGQPTAPAPQTEGVAPVPLAERSAWGRKLAEGDLRAKRGGGAAARVESLRACSSRFARCARPTWTP